MRLPRLQCQSPVVILLLLLQLVQCVKSSEQVLRRNTVGNAIEDDETQARILAPQSRIVGGVEASPGEYSGFAWWDQGCGATLIHEDIALSAAHCYTGNLGILYLNSTLREQGYQAVVEFARVHPNYNHKRNDPDWDFLILILREPVPSDIARPVALNRDAAVPSQVAQALLAVGFGRTEEGGGSNSDTLQHVLLPYIPNDMCGEGSYGVNKIGIAMMCAGEDGKDACQGDSGGPLFLADKHTQVGITSWGMGCARAGFPGVYSRISTGFPWIQAQVCLESANPPAEFCQGASVPIPLTLELSIYLDEDNWEDFAFGLHAIDTLTTLIRQPPQNQGESNGYADSGMIPPPSIELRSTNSTTNTTTSVRKKDDKGPARLQEEDPQLIDTTELPPNVFQQTWSNVTPGTYYFQIRNPSGQGFSSPNSQARLTQGGGRLTLIDVPRNFESYWDIYVTVDEQMLISKIRQSPPEQEDLVELTVDFYYDDHPDQTAWELRNVNTSSVVAFVPYFDGNNVTQTPQFVSYTNNVTRGYSYQLRLWDTGGDGLNHGWVNVWVGNFMVWTLGDDKDFEYEYSTIFDIPTL